MSDSSTKRRPVTQKGVSDLVVRRALELFQKHPARRWTVDELTQTLGVSRPALGRRFKAALGQAPLRALRSLRMTIAEELLRETDHGLAHIASEIGYESEFAFSRAFTRHTGGIRPGQFRRASGAPLMLAA
jgi:transcriptional regulator GlxA family with amidase domain